MSFHVDYDGLDQLYAGLYGNASAWNGSIATLSENVKALVSSQNMTGAGADNIKLYLDSIHNTIIPILNSLLTAHVNNCLLYVRNYQSGIDTSLHAVIDESVLRQIKSALKVQQSSAEYINSSVQRTLNAVSDIVPVSCPGFYEIADDSNEIQRLLERLLTDICDLEDNHYQNDFVDTSELISSLRAFISEHLAASRSYKTNFSVEALARSNSFLALSQAYLAVDTQMQTSQDAVLQALKEENGRIEALNAEVEARQKEATTEKWVVTGLCVVGSIVAIGVIVASGGTATPLVVGAVSAVSGAIIAGNNAAADAYVAHGWDTSQWDMKSIGTSAVLGGVTGFVTGYVGAGISSAVSGGLSSAGSTLVNSSSMAVRVGSNAVIGATSQVVSGAAARGTSTFVGTMITTEGDVATSVDTAWDAATNPQQMLIDAATGGVAGGIRGIQKPATAAPVRSEEDLIDDGPYIKDGKPRGRPALTGDEKLEFEQEVYDAQIVKSKDGLLHDPNTGEVIDWKPGDPRKGVVDFGHKSGLEYADMFEKYKYGEISLDELKEFQFNPEHYQLEAPSANRSHVYEAPDIPSSSHANSHLGDGILSAARVARAEN